MPVWDFVCYNCNKDFEELVKSNQKDVPCPHCKSLNTKKLLIARNGETFKPIFKGVGFPGNDMKNSKR